MDRSLTHNANVLHTRNSDEIATDLFNGIATGEFRLFEVASEPSAREQIYRAFRETDERGRRNLRNGIEKAASQWRQADGPLVIANLATIAARVGAVGILKTVRARFKNGSLHRNDEVAAEAMNRIVDALGGLLPHEDAEHLLEKVYVEEGLERYVPSIFAAFLRIGPDRFASMAPRFSQVLAEQQIPFRVDLILKTLARRLSWKTLAQEIRRLPPLERNHFCAVIMKHCPETISVDLDQSSGTETYRLASGQASSEAIEVPTAEGDFAFRWAAYDATSEEVFRTQRLRMH